MIKIQIVNKPPKDNNYFWLSVSKVKTFQGCKAKYYYCYIEKLPRKNWPHTHFGKFLHEILELFQKEIINGNLNTDNVILKKCFNYSYNNNYKDKITVEQKQEAYDILIKFLAFRDNKKKAATLSTPISVEKPFNIVLNDKILVNGYIDFIQKDFDDFLHVSDYKTSKDKKYLVKDLFQLKTYSWVLFLEDPNLEKIRTSYSMLKFNFDEIVKEFTKEQVMNTAEYFVQCHEEITEEKLFRTNPSPLCKYCDYLGNCKDGINFMGMMEARKAKKDGKTHLPAFGETDW